MKHNLYNEIKSSTLIDRIKKIGSDHSPVAAKVTFNSELDATTATEPAIATATAREPVTAKEPDATTVPEPIIIVQKNLLDHSLRYIPQNFIGITLNDHVDLLVSKLKTSNLKFLEADRNLILNKKAKETEIISNKELFNVIHTIYQEMMHKINSTYIKYDNEEKQRDYLSVDTLLHDIFFTSNDKSFDEVYKELFSESPVTSECPDIIEEIKKFEHYKTMKTIYDIAVEDRKYVTIMETYMHDEDHFFSFEQKNFACLNEKKYTRQPEKE